MSFNGNLYSAGGSDSGLDLTNKGQIHTHSATDQAALSVGADGTILIADSSEATGLKWSTGGTHVLQSFIVAASDETTAITAGTDKVTFRMPYAFTITSVRASLSTAGSTSGVTTIDIHESGTTILSTKITIDYGETTSTTAATPPVISDSSLADDAEMTVDVDGVSGGGAETGLKVTLIGYKT